MAHSRHVFYQKQKKAASKTAYDLLLLAGRDDRILKPARPPLTPQGLSPI